MVPFESSVPALGLANFFVNIGSQRVFYVIIARWYRDMSGKHRMIPDAVFPTAEYLGVIVTRKQTRFPRGTVFFFIFVKKYIYIFLHNYGAFANTASDGLDPM